MKVSEKKQKHFTDMEKRVLLSLNENGFSDTEISKLIPWRSAQSIHQLIYRMSNKKKKNCTPYQVARNNGRIKACSYLQKYETKQKKRKNNDEGNHRNNKKQKVYKIRLNTSPKNAREVVMAYREV